MEREITVEDVFKAKSETLCLEHLNPDTPLSRTLIDADVLGPGLALAGYTERFPKGRMLVFGQTEMMYLDSLDQSLATDRLSAVFSFDVPAIVISKGQGVPDVLLENASRAGTAVLRSPRTTSEVFRRLKSFLEEALAPHVSLHGSLADVYGVGLLFTGKSGVGKSECVLDLVERGHRLVADDLVVIHSTGNDVLIGAGHDLQKHHMEIRGVGIIDVPAVFGIRSIRLPKRVEVVVQLETWEDGRAYDRTGLETDEIEIAGVSLPKVTIPLNPGKNITVVCEVVAMNHLLKYAGVDSAARFDQHIRDAMRVRPYLEQDYE